ncbi:hypothetical protein PGT21_008513 [Puccinia graminis f. sp. tritici]|uniref:Uncharacterized protein n=2 Tax=Puccinia graminis f. sp. tritici TaxID=56615 RepID=H6QSL1_PUCGT|nr:uncharacterized protein PGTG_21825 [Puccinia graminis f. sp. tritici CRL 75-36-700-3]EHS63733.1 hypothetical protein PGTG_21825 [Puccinia graminis f. sp. tritici CRL 75-36-700-3]KAA1074518.1 hypothetical protein PGT21_008513 [Puccinia graminis f. sp. tritici]
MRTFGLQILILFFGTIKLCAGEIINCDRDPKACEERGGSRSHNPYCPGLPPSMQARCCDNGEISSRPGCHHGGLPSGRRMV